MSDPVAAIQTVSEDVRDAVWEQINDRIIRAAKYGENVTHVAVEAAIAAVWPLAVTQTRQEIAATVVEVRAHYPEDVFPESSDSVEARAAAFARKTCDNIIHYAHLGAEVSGGPSL